MTPADEFAQAVAQERADEFDEGVAFLRMSGAATVATAIYAVCFCLDGEHRAVSRMENLGCDTQEQAEKWCAETAAPSHPVLVRRVEAVHVEAVAS